MADEEYTTEHEGDQVVWFRVVVRGLEGGLRESVAANEPRHFHRGEVVTLAVDAVVDHVAYPPHKPLDDDDEEEGVDRLHITKLVTAAFVDREGPVAAALDAQAARNEAARSERAAAREAKKAEKAAERKAAREAAKAARKAGVPGGVDGAMSLLNDDGQVPEDVTDAERAAMAVVG